MPGQSMATSTATSGVNDREAAEASGDSAENIFLFVPNVIGYTRIIIAICSFHYMPLHPRRCMLLYCISCILDALDGLAARRFKQSTRFGAVLDMVTDRCTTSCLLVFLAIAQPAYASVFQALISLDFASHYMHMYATLVMGGQGKSHKTVSASRSWIMNFYYQKWVLLTCCAMNELFFIGLYLLCFSTAEPSISSSVAKGNTGAKLDPTMPKALVAISGPIMLFKQYVNVEQLIKACQWLAEGDRENRRRAERSRND